MYPPFDIIVRLEFLMKSLMGVILAIVMVLGFARPNMVHAVDKGLESAVRIEYSETGGRWMTLGSGAAVKIRGPFGRGPRYGILTAHHVAEFVEDGYVRACRVQTNHCVLLDVYTHKAQAGEGPLGYDWAVMNTYTLPQGTSTARIARYEPKLGQSVAIIGHPWGDFGVKHGTLSSKIGFADESIYTIDGYVAGGASGGPVIDMNGRIVGLVSAAPIRRSYPHYMPIVAHNEILVVPVHNTGL
jgi:hypothetical protein